MSEFLSTGEVTMEVNILIKGKSPLIAVLSSIPSKGMILIGRDGQQWLLTVQEIPKGRLHGIRY